MAEKKRGTIKRVDVELGDLIKDLSKQQEISERLASRQIARSFKKRRVKDEEITF